MCEQRGSGVDRALEAIEAQNLPPPHWKVVEGSTVVTMFKEKPFASLSREDRMRGCFQHASLRMEANEPMSNASLRQRFGLSQRQYPQVSEIIRDCIEEGWIRPLTGDQSNRLARYVPILD